VNKLRWGKFYWSDWADDPALALCSLAAQGLWMRLLCLAAQGTPYGHVTINGKAATVEQIDALINVDRRGHGPRYVPKLIDELVRNGVAFIGNCGCLVSRRMERDGEMFLTRHKAAEKRWKQRTNDEETTNKTVIRNSRKAAENGQSDHGLHMQTESFASTDLDTQNLESESPPTPRMRGAGRTGWKNGYGESANTDLQESAENAEADNSRPRGARVVPIPRHPRRRQH
jgi:hypothetical protein